MGHRPVLVLLRLLSHHPRPLIYVADPASASHGWSLMRSGGLERDRAREREGEGGEVELTRLKSGREREKARRR